MLSRNFKFTPVSILQAIFILEMAQILATVFRVIPFLKIIIDGDNVPGPELLNAQLASGTLSFVLITQLTMLYVLRRAIKEASQRYLKIYLIVACVPYIPSIIIFYPMEFLSMTKENMNAKLTGLGLGTVLYLINIIKIVAAYKCYKRLGGILIEKLEEMRATDEEMGDKQGPGLHPIISPEAIKAHAISPWDVDMGEAIGQGNFGIVFKGILVKDKKKIPVAVKMMKQVDNSFAFSMVAQEIKIMIYAGSHKHIVQFHGITSLGNALDSILIVTELCTGGTLLDQLHELRSQEEANFPSYQNLNDGQHARISSELFRYSKEIAEGMEYLAKRKIVHGDLATRNVLLTAQLQVKISDFGLARKMYSYQMYLALDKNGVAIPWKWSSVEVLEDLKFSEASDVWAYGVTLWEIYSLGIEPYEDEIWSSIFIQQLKAGRRLDKPNYASHDIYELMKECWLLDRKERITFSSLLQKLEDVLRVLGN